MNGSILNCNIVITDLPNDSDFKEIYFNIKNHIVYLKVECFIHRSTVLHVGT